MFSEDKVLQIIGYLLYINDSRMNLLKLMKELYLIDRESINERGTSLSGDIHFSLEHGPILSMTLNILVIKLNENKKWHEYMHSEAAKYYDDIVLDKIVPSDRLSVKDKEYIEKVSNKFKDYTEFEIEKYTHENLDEWKNPEGSSKKITFSDIMLALGKSQQDITDMKEEYRFANKVSDLIESK